MFAATAERLLAQGVATHTAKAIKRPAPSGRPFNAHFVDVAAAAGLTAPTIYGGVEGKKYILEATGCGCAFLDYDNDGWMDIFLLTGTRLEGAPPDASNRLYQNNRDGTFTDVTEKAGLRAVDWASGVCIGDYNNDGFEDIFVTCFGQNRLYRNNGDGTFTDVTKAAGLWNEQPRWGAGMQLPGLQPGWPPRSVRLQLRSLLIRTRSRARGEQQLQLERHSRGMRTARAAHRKTFPVPQQWRRNIHGCEQAGGYRERHRKLWNDGSRG